MDFIFIVSCISLAYIFYIYLLWFTRKEKSYPINEQGFSVIIPCYNEGYKELKECVESCLKAEGNHEVILVDNNSNKPETTKAIEELSKSFNLIVTKELRQGKRFAHSKGLSLSKYELIVFVDSDTVVEKNAFVELIKPLSDERIGAVAGQIKVANRNDNFLTKSLSAMFWTSCNIFRKASSSFGYMGVIAGALGSYRKDLLLKLEKEYLNQTFLGRPCSISDDRYITMRIQTRFKKRIEYCENAVGYTYVPNRFKQTWKMLERWRRGVLRETILIWKEPFYRAKLLMLDVQINAIMLFGMFIAKFIAFYNLALNFSILGLVYTIIWFLIISTMYSSIMVFENFKEFRFKILWSLLYEFFFIFTLIPALFKIRNQGVWNTR